MNAHAYHLNPMEREDAYERNSAAIRDEMIGHAPEWIAGIAFHEARQWVVDNLLPIHLAGDAIDFSRLLERDGITRLCESQGEWPDLSDDDRAIVIAECHAELRRYRAARPIPTTLPTVAAPCAPGYLKGVE
jgi:hypothetical protein